MYLIQKDTCTPMLTAAPFTIGKPWKRPKCPLTDEQLEKCGIYIHTQEYYSTIKRNEIRYFAATWVDLEIITVSERKDKHHMITYMRNLKNNTNELIYKTKADTQKAKL